MDVILTHEQADFDALASLLGARLLHEGAAILPRRINRNVKAFLNLYGADLPFTDPRDLPSGSVGQVILVDTQALVTLKGIGPGVPVRVIDHHQVRAGLPAAWETHVEPVGATATLLSEALQEAGQALNNLQATLLLLGIYEDTGSLAYAGTTPRDIRAAAFLLEQGADLRIVGRFLNPPLSPDQRLLYERLLAAAEWHPIGGQNILISTALATEMNEEISSVAHKMRDLLDPDALFLLAATQDGIRIVARSTSDRVNAARVAAHFGGGGHERAAAALIHVDRQEGVSPEASLADCKNRLLEALPGLVNPSTLVGQIMSRKPRVLSPDVPVGEAARLMQRYGYEGFPVVQDGKVAGLLTRRVVDRALSHRLNLPAGSLMEAGSVTVEPGQPIEHLQKVMAASGWGQVPVVDPASGQIVGIVTRTDLLKILSPEAHPTGRRNLAGRLEEALPAARLGLLKLVADQAHQDHLPAYIVGGFVRDLVAGKAGLDFDVVVEGDAISLARQLSGQYGGTVTSHKRFGTAKWDISAIKSALVEAAGDGGQPEDLPDKLDLISARTEFYEKPTALPVVESGSIKLDLHRRDFTINTLALRLDGRHFGELHDYWGGLNDLSSGLVRVLHSLSFIDDPTRMLRAVRFEQRFGFQIEKRTLHLMSEARQLLRQVSADRVRHELDLILAEEKACLMLARLSELGLLESIHWALPATLRGDWQSVPEAHWRLGGKVNSAPRSRALAWMLWLAPLAEDKARSIARRLRLPGWLTDLILQAGSALADLPGLMGAPVSVVGRRLDDLHPTVVYTAYQLSEDSAVKDILLEYARRWRELKPEIDGSELRRRDLPPGPRYREVLQRLRDARRDGLVSTREEEETLLEQILREPAGEQAGEQA